jgi:hypothetical protein
MTGGGILSLVAYGAQNVILSGNPQMTYFYKAFKRYSHFAMENITIPLEGSNELSFDSPIQIRAKIPRFGDLMNDLVFSFRVPDIYSKYVAGRGAQYEFQWSRYLGLSIIRNAAFFVGGQKIQEFDGRYLLTKALLDDDQDMFLKWQRLVGDIPELNDPAKGAYAGGTARDQYPTVYLDPSSPTNQQTNRPSIYGRDIHVPLTFWFAEAASQALPLIALQYHECEVQLTLNPISQLYTILDVSGYRVNPDFVMRASATDIQRNNPAYAATTDLSGQIRNFFTDIGFPVPPMNGWFLNARLQGNFIYLPADEQKIFAVRPLSYVMRQITNYPFPGLFSRQVLDIETHNPITRLVFVQQRSDTLNRNAFSNFTNWVNYPLSPYKPTPTHPTASGILMANVQRDMIRSIRVLCDGNEIQEQKPVEFFTEYTAYRYAVGIGSDGLPLYSFQLDQSATQPSGSINASRIRNFQVELDVWPLPVDPAYTYDVNIYVENLNFFETASGMGGLKYAL